MTLKVNYGYFSGVCGIAGNTDVYAYEALAAFDKQFPK